MFRYYLNATDKEKTMETCMTCREKEEEGEGAQNSRLTARALAKGYGYTKGIAR